MDATYLASGALLVSWLEAVGEGAEWRVCRISADGERGEAATIATASGERSGGFLRLERHADGALASWTDDDSKRVRVARIRLE